MAAADEVEAYLGSVAGLDARRLAHAEWGITIPGDSVGGDPWDLWVHADILVSDADERGVDRLLGLVTEAVVAARRLRRL